jgi:phosphoglycerate dehydrogenase-like enzyme
MEILLSSDALTRFGAQIHAAAPGITFVTPSAPSTPQPDVAWLSTDLFYSSEAGRFYEIIAQAPSLAWLQSSAAGLDLPVYRGLLARGVTITSSHANSVSIAEFVLGSVLRTMQRPDAWADAQRRHAWEHHEFDEIAGTTWLIIGFGAIGQAIASRARSFGASVIGVRRSPGAHPAADEIINPDALRDRLGDADVVVLCRPGNPDGSTLFDAALLRELRDSSLLINVGRGSLIDVDALLDALESGRPAIAILDVFDPEPLEPTSPLFDHPRVVITPHSSAGGRGRHQRNADLFVRNLEAFLNGRPLENVIASDDLPMVIAPPAQFQV